MEEEEAIIILAIEEGTQEEELQASLTLKTISSSSRHLTKTITTIITITVEITIDLVFKGNKHSRDH